MLTVSNRLEKIRQKLTENGIDAILISQPENIYYLSGFNGSRGYLLITPKEAILATTTGYTEQAKEQTSDYHIHRITYFARDWFPCLVAKMNIKRLGIEAGHISFTFYRELTDILEGGGFGIGLVPMEGFVESLRVTKEPEEIENITKAAEITDTAMEYIEETIHPGMSEKEAAWEIEKFIWERGSRGLAFEFTINSGPNSALLHASPSERLIQSGEPIAVDIGAKWNGYCSDLTRTFCLGTPDETFKKVYDAVLRAQMAALTAIEEGMTGDQADNLARTVIEQAGYGEAFGHSLGHGVGLAVHEQPLLVPKCEEVLTSGMVFTIEPGIYISGWGGVRIEDLVVMEDGKVRAISKARKYA